MQFSIHFLLLASATCLTSAFKFEDLGMFIPMLRNIPTQTCPPNELYRTCTGMCSDCEQRGMCVVRDCTAGCDCVPRFYRVTPDGPCVPVAQCPRPECGENEVFRECGNVCERCATAKCQVIGCDYKCYCKQGYLRNEQGICIPAEECPVRRCGRNEEWAESGPVDEYCIHDEDVEVNNGTQNVPKCYCKEGFKRNTFGSCISISLCPMIKCLGVEVYYKCVPKCNATCRSNVGNTTCVEDEDCHSGCFCPKGHRMNDFRSCIPEGNCSLDMPVVKVINQPAFEVDEESSDSENSTDFSVNETTYSTETSEYPSTDETSEDESRDSKEISSASEAPMEITSASEPDQSDTESPGSPTMAKGSKERDNGKIKYTRSPKHANAAASGKASGQKDDFANDDI